MQDENPYPFTEKRKQYRAYDAMTLAWALVDAQEAQKQADALWRAGCPHSGKGPNWRADDVHTIQAELTKRSR